MKEECPIIVRAMIDAPGIEPRHIVVPISAAQLEAIGDAMRAANFADDWPACITRAEFVASEAFAEVCDVCRPSVAAARTQFVTALQKQIARAAIAKVCGECTSELIEGV